MELRSSATRTLAAMEKSLAVPSALKILCYGFNGHRLVLLVFECVIFDSFVYFCSPNCLNKFYLSCGAQLFVHSLCFLVFHCLYYNYFSVVLLTDIQITYRFFSVVNIIIHMFGYTYIYIYNICIDYMLRNRITTS